MIKEDGYPDYARPENGRTVQKRQDIFDNRHVVSHSRELLVQFDCHINLEVCGSIKAVKYIHKYIYKGPDRATIQAGAQVNEISSYLDARYIFSTQACHNIFEFPMHKKWPAVYHLPVHLPNQQNIVFRAGAPLQEVVDNIKDTKLMGCFKGNQDPDLIAAGAHNHLYQEFPKHFVWNDRRAVWTVRQRYKAIGRMYSNSPSAGEAFYLHLLLTVVKGVYHSSFQAHACMYFIFHRCYIL